MDTQKLRQRILDLAIRGKLVPQDPNDEPASVLLERIRAEKERLIAEGKIKRPKAKKSTDKSHYQNFTPPFDIPASWQWVRIADISSDILYGVSESAKTEGSYKLLRITDIQNSGVNWDNVPYTEYDPNKVKQFLLQNGDLLFARTGATVGKSYLVEDVPTNAIYASYLIRIRTVREVLPEYLKLFFESGFYWTQITLGSVGIGQPNVNGTSLGQLILPIPPRSEQIRILSATSRILDTISDISASSHYLLDLISVAKSKILDLAMQGKLVPQDPADESAAEMLHRINPKAKIITDNPHSWNVPANWTVCNLGDTVKIRSAKRVMKSDWRTEGVPFYRTREIVKLSENGIVDNELFISYQLYDEYRDKYGIPVAGDIMITAVGTIGKTYIVRDNDKFYYKDASVLCISPYPIISSDFLTYLFRSEYLKKQFMGNSKGTTVDTITIEKVNGYTIVLPPFNEQKRIVAKIEELYSVLDKIEASLRS